MNASRAAGCCAVLLLLAAPPAAAEPQRFSFATARRVVDVAGARVSPDGRTVAAVVTRPDYADNRNESEIYAVDLATGAARPLTFERRSAAAPRWSPDGATLAFLAPDSSGHAQIWLLPMRGGEARRLTRSKTDVQHYSWRPDGAAIAYAAADEEPKREGEARHLATMRVGDQDLFLRSPLRPQHIWLAPLDGAEPRRLTAGDWSLEMVLPPGSPPSRLSWSPDGKQIAFASVPSAQSGHFDSVSVRVLDVESGAVRPLTGAARFENNPVWSPDGAAVVYAYPREGRGDRGWSSEIHLAPAAGGPGRSLTRALDRVVYGADWMPDGRSVLVAANDRTSVGLWIQPVDGPARRLDLGEPVINGAFGYDVTVSAQGTIVFAATTPGRPAELYALDAPEARPRRLTDFNAWADSVDWGRVERVAWKGPDGFDEDGVLTLPPGFDAARRYPLVLVIHGGPQASSKANFSTLAQLFAADGYLVFQPNYRGSDNLGNAYLTAIRGDAGRGPGRDVMAGIAELRRRPYVDPRRTAVTGWSYGGYMSTWLAGNYPDEWTCVVAGAPVTDFAAQYNLSDFNVQSRFDVGGSPWKGDGPRLYREQSPITYATRIKAPTLILSLLEDFRVPPVQALSLYHALKDNGVETEYVGFPGRGHNPRDPAHSAERMRLQIEWVKRHLPAGR